MKSGLSTYMHRDNELATKFITLVKVLMIDALTSADKFVHACSRSCITAKDIKMALMYEAHEFMSQPNLEEKFLAVFERQQNPQSNRTMLDLNDDLDDLDDLHDLDYSSDSGESAESVESDKSRGFSSTCESACLDNSTHQNCNDMHDDQKGQELYSTLLCSDNLELAALHAKFIKYHAEWHTWQPTDEVAIFMKNAIDKTSTQLDLET